MVQIFSSWRAAKRSRSAQPRHAAVLVHDLADHRRRRQAGEAREVDAALGLAGAHQHAAARARAAGRRARA